jgi:hypothetical protein
VQKLAPALGRRAPRPNFTTTHTCQTTTTSAPRSSVSPR